MTLDYRPPILYADRNRARFECDEVARWTRGAYTYRLDVFGTCVLRLSRWKGRLLLSTAWRYSYELWWADRPRLEERRATMARIYSELEAGLLPGRDLTTDLHRWVTGRFKQTRTSGATVATLARGKVHDGGHWTGRHDGSFLDHPDWFRDDRRRVALAIGHNYDGQTPAEAHGSRMDPDPRLAWVTAPYGVSWYYPGRATALLVWAPEVHPEIGPDLEALLGVQVARVLA